MTSDDLKDDAELLRRCAAGDETAYAELIARFERPLIGYICRLTGNSSAAEDIFQEVFLRVTCSVGRFSPRCRVSTWLYTIAHNLCVDFLRKASRAKCVSMTAAEGSAGRGEKGGAVREIADLRFDAAHTVEKAEEARRLRACLLELAEPKREALILRVFEGLPYEEMAAITGARVGTLKFRVHEAVRELAMKLNRPENKSEGGKVVAC
ncbi:MAG: RNA polymerase sigma factor [Planctomycetota bacterium]|nr:RNA polymerase sigma factor [Planctomycetota bacterium]